MKTLRLIFVIGLGAVSGAPLTVCAEFVFEKREIVRSLLPDEDVLSVEFPFTVKGKKAVTIKEYRSACSCLSAEITDGRLTWMPGEKGIVRGNFKLGTLKGKIEKKIVLVIEGEEAPLVLTTRLDIPHLFRMEPATLFWDLNGDGATQTFRIKVLHDAPINVLDIACTNVQFNFELKVIKPGWEYEVEVTPDHVKERAFGLLRLKNDCRFKKHASAQAFMVVRVPKVAPGKGD